METFFRIALPVSWLTFVGLTIFWRSFLPWRQTGVNAYKLKNDDSAQGYNANLFKVAVFGSGFAVLVFSVFPGFLPWLGPLAWLENPAIKAVGLVLMAVATLWIVAAQGQMGASWRIGFDEKEKTHLVQSGLFGISRNPIFLGMRLLLAALFLVSPNALTLAIWALGEASIQTQVRLEEAYLLREQGATYAAYCQRVRRWL